MDLGMLKLTVLRLSVMRYVKAVVLKYVEVGWT